MSEDHIARALGKVIDGAFRGPSGVELGLSDGSTLIFSAAVKDKVPYLNIELRPSTTCPMCARPL